MAVLRSAADQIIRGTTSHGTSLLVSDSRATAILAMLQTRALGMAKVSVPRLAQLTTFGSVTYINPKHKSTQTQNLRFADICSWQTAAIASNHTLTSDTELRTVT